ncbi:MAG: YifB family Mg chelatase-like AAA ATPase [Candidatus Nanopelagicales bacterium]
MTSLARTHSVIVHGVTAHVVEVQASLSPGLPNMSLVGLPDTALKESRDRVRAAVVNSGLKWPEARITIGLSPASLPKRGTGLDVAIALAVLAANAQLPADQIARVVVLGELGLDGRIRGVAGALAAALAVRQRASTSSLSGVMILGPVDAAAVTAVPGLEILTAPTLRVLVARLRGDQELDEDVHIDQQPIDAEHTTTRNSLSVRGASVAPVDLRDVAGQQEGKRALEIAAAGGHHLAMLGRAGVGKTLLAERLPDLLPDLNIEDSLDVTAIHQLAGSPASVGGSLLTRPPWCAPHHTATRPALVGGGREDKPTIGMATLAHRGVLFLDEAAEFEPAALDALREPLESGEVSIARAGFRMTFPARFLLLLAANPCPCGNALDPNPSATCRCTPHQRRRYLARLSGPLMDRLDLRVVLTKPTIAELKGLTGSGQSTKQVADRVRAARERSRHRMSETPWTLTAQVPARELFARWPLPTNSQRLIDQSCTRESVRGRDRLQRVAWTIADLDGHRQPTCTDVDQAIALRASDQEWTA